MRDILYFTVFFCVAAIIAAIALTGRGTQEKTGSGQNAPVRVYTEQGP